MNTSELKQAFQAYRRSGPCAPRPAPGRYSRLVDQWIVSVARNLAASPSPVLILAVGGYGRGELFPHSDIDVLVSMPDAGGPDPEDLARALFLPLWDAGFELGHGIRTQAETASLARRDFEVACALLDARLVFGPVSAFRAFMATMTASVLVPERSRLVEWLGQRLESRQRASDVHFIAPHLKEGRGCLRDAQTIAWLDRVFALTDSGHESFLTADEKRALHRHRSFLSSVRVCLHQLGTRKNDVLHLDVQPDLAARMGFGEQSSVRGVERFLSRLHRAMADIQLLSRLTLARARLGKAGVHGERFSDGLDFSALSADPGFVLELFRHSVQTGSPLGWEARRTIQAGISLYPQGWRRDHADKFETVLRAHGAAQALEQMFETGFLSAFVPEFGRVAYVVQYDAYHLRPVAAHLLETVRQVDHVLPDDEFLGEYLAPVRFEPGLRWAALLHDIGKGEEDHSLRGAVLGREIMTRLGRDPKTVDTAEFLIRHHLLLVHTATRRDLGEEGVIVGLAQTVGSVARLDLLTLLTVADSRATGPKAWTPWICNLLRELYFKTRNILESFLSGEHSASRLARVRDALRRARPEGWTGRDFERVLMVMPARYLLQTPDSRILAHIDLVREFRAAGAPFVMTHEHEPLSRSFQLTLIGRDRAGFFARACVALHRHGLAIWSAELCTWDDGTVVDVLWVGEPADMLYADHAFDRVRKTLVGLLEDESGLDTFQAGVTTRHKKGFAADEELVSVRADNNFSDFHTVLTVRAPDAGGLLATVSLALYRLGVDVILARIATQADKAMDTFHVRHNGEKIPDGELSRLEACLRLLLCSLYA